MENEHNLSVLAEHFIKDLEPHKLSQESILSYHFAVQRIIKFARSKGIFAYYPGLGEEYANCLNQKRKTGEITKRTWTFNTRVLRMFVSLAETGRIDFTRKPIEQRLYILSDQGEKLAYDILEYSDITERRYGENIALVRHVLWYAKEAGYELLELDDEILLDFICEEAPKSNSGSMYNVIRIVRRIAKYFQDHDLGNVLYSYDNLKIRGGGRKLLPSYKPEEVKAMIDCLETDNPTDRRNRAMILLGYTTGLRCIDVIKLKYDEIDFRKQCLRITQNKTGVPMIVEVPAITLNALADYILEYRPKIDLNYVFITGMSQYKEINRSLNWMMASVEERAGVEHIPFRGFHGLRRSFAVSLASAEVPLDTLSKMLGHISPGSDKTYLSFNHEEIGFVALSFKDVPIRSKIYSNLLYFRIDDEEEN